MSTFKQPIVEIHFTDSTSKTVKTVLADQIKYCQVARRHGWPTIQEDQVFASYFIAFAALQRQGDYTKDWSTFIEEAIAITPVGSDDVNPMMQATRAGF